MQIRKEDYSYTNKYDKKPLTRNFDPEEANKDYMEARLKEIVFFANMALFSVIMVISTYLFLMTLPIYFAIPAAMCTSFLLLQATRLRRKIKKSRR